jgi:hypothetical protein
MELEYLKIKLTMLMMEETEIERKLAKVRTEIKTLIDEILEAN